MFIEIFFEFLNHLRVVVLLNITLNHDRLLSSTSLSPHRWITKHVYILFHFFKVVFTVVVSILFRLHIHEKSYYHPAEVMSSHRNLSDSLNQLLISQKALFQAWVQKIAMQSNNIVNSLYMLQRMFKLVKVWLKNFDLHVVHIVFWKLKHPVT